MTQTLQDWTIIFDLDGTLVDSAPDLHAALNHCLEGGGYPSVPFGAISGMIGLGAEAMIRQGLDFHSVEADDAARARLFEAFLEHYGQNLCRLSRPYPGTLSALETLRTQGAGCAVCTNKTQGLSDALLNGLGLADRFSAIVGADSVPDRKPAGDHILKTIERAGGNPARAIMVGDSQTDERAARNAGLPFIFVTFGYGPAPAGLSEILSAESYPQVVTLVREEATRPRP